MLADTIVDGRPAGRSRSEPAERFPSSSRARQQRLERGSWGRRRKYDLHYGKSITSRRPRLGELRRRGFWLEELDVFGKDRHVCAVSLMGARGEGIDVSLQATPAVVAQTVGDIVARTPPATTAPGASASAFPRFREVAAAAFDLGCAPRSKRGRSRGRCVRHPACAGRTMGRRTGLLEGVPPI